MRTDIAERPAATPDGASGRGRVDVVVNDAGVGPLATFAE